MFSQKYASENKPHLSSYTETAEQDQRVYDSALRIAKARVALSLLLYFFRAGAAPTPCFLSDSQQSQQGRAENMRSRRGGREREREVSLFSPLH